MQPITSSAFTAVHQHVIVSFQNLTTSVATLLMTAVVTKQSSMQGWATYKAAVRVNLWPFGTLPLDRACQHNGLQVSYSNRAAAVKHRHHQLQMGIDITTEALCEDCHAKTDPSLVTWQTLHSMRTALCCLAKAGYEVLKLLVC